MKSLWQNEFQGAFQDRAVLVTDASGFLGGHLCEALCRLGARVSGVAMTLDEGETSADVTRFALDLRDLDATRSVLEEVRPEYIFHLAGLVTTSPDESLVLPMLEHNLVASVNLFSLASEIGCLRLVHTGTSEENRAIGQASAPASPYAAANRAATDYAMMFNELYGLPTTVVRPYLSFGPRQPIDKLIPSAIRRLLAGKKPVINNPDIEFEYLYCDDVVRAFLTAALAGDAPGKIMDLHTGEKVSIQKIIQVLENVVNNRAAPREDPQAGTLDTHSIENWKPIWALKPALVETIRWYEQNQSVSAGTPS